MAVRKGLWSRITKFSIVGAINTAVDVLLLNLLINVAGFRYLLDLAGFKIVAANLVSVSVAIVNSYLLNKYWTFAKRGANNIKKEATLFVFISLAGMIVNTVVLSLFYSHWRRPVELLFSFAARAGLSGGAEDWFALNVAKGLAIAASMTWNFIAYSRWAFPSAKRS